MNLSVNLKANQRALEIDLIRGIALFLMLLDHLAFDLRYFLNCDGLAFVDSSFFLDIVRPSVLVFFLLASGISTAFSRSDLIHARRIGIAAIGLSLVSFAVEAILQLGFIIYFNVLHVICLALLLRALFAQLFARLGRIGMDLCLIFVSGLFAVYISQYQTLENYSFLSLILGFRSDSLPEMADYLSLFPWAIFIYLGALIGDLYYPKSESEKGYLISSQKPAAFFIWLGQYPLWVYLIHQPIFLAIVYLLKLILQKH
ncbi:MAG: heparan-alpha-glucosaminide N-acetyltransferase domain-containing protein [Eubacteriales bacterium]|nr:heparan-alpha-glucosaminide N-acetyltransferase domain-containing protein [Eubacteriales bacterium]